MQDSMQYKALRLTVNDKKEVRMILDENIVHRGVLKREENKWLLRLDPMVECMRI